MKIVVMSDGQYFLSSPVQWRYTRGMTLTFLRAKPFHFASQYARIFSIPSLSRPSMSFHLM